MKINVHIERIILDGQPFDRHSAPLIQEAVQAELTRLFADNGAPQSLLSGGSVLSLRGEPFQLDAKSEPEAVGQRVANAVYGGLQS